MRTTLIDDENMKLDLEVYEGIPVPHVEIKRWSHILLKNYFYPKWGELLERLKEQGYTFVLGMLHTSDVKKIKFLNLMGMYEEADNGEYVVLRRWL